jgi:tetratricopeptide (TPR) repeat protein
MKSFETNRCFYFYIGLFLLLSFLLIQCSDSIAGKVKDKKDKRRNTSELSAETGTIESKNAFAKDSLLSLLETSIPDSTRLGILDRLATIEKDDSIITLYNIQIEILANGRLSDNPPSNLKNLYLQFISNSIFRKGNISTNQYDFPKALEYFNQSLKLCIETGNKIGITNAYISIGNTYYYKGEIQKAIECYEKSLKLSKEIGDKANISRSLNNLGIMYSDLDNAPKSLEYYKENLKVQEELGDKSSIAFTLNNLGNVYSDQGNMPKALEFYSKCLIISEEVGDKKSISSSLSNLGTIYEYQKDFSTALEYYNRSLKILEEIGDKSIAAATLTNMANIFIDKATELASHDSIGRDSLIKMALEYYYRSLNFSEEINDKKVIIETLINIGHTYEEQAVEMTGINSVDRDSLNRKALACYNRSLVLGEEIGDRSSISFALVRIGTIYLRRNETLKALDFAKKAYGIAKETGYIFNIRDAAELLDKVYLRQGIYRLSRKYYGEYISVRDSIIKDENQQLFQKKYYQYQYEKKAATDSIAHDKAMEIANLQIEKQKDESRRQKMVILFIAIGLLLVLVLAGYIFRSLRVTRKQKRIIENQKKVVDDKNILLGEQNEEIISQRDEIEVQRDMVVKQKEYIENIHDELKGSIRYAERIQKAVLPSAEFICEITAECKLSVNDYFILYKPRDIVSGDFYFFGKRGKILFIAAADCTGHGVPGAFMSMLGLSFLNEIIAQDFQTAGQILDELRKNIVHSLQQKGVDGEQKDGLDISFVSYDLQTKEIQYAGANNPLYLVRFGSMELTVIQPDTMPVAIYDRMDPFTNHIIQLNMGDSIYMASDGYGDQFGGPEGRKFMLKKFKQLLAEISAKSISEQKQILEQTLEDWKYCNGTVYPQTDDITVIGIKIP